MTIAANRIEEQAVGVVTLGYIVQRVRPALTGMDRTVYQGSDGWCRGVEQGNEADYVTIAINNVWGAQAGNASISSYEKIGYHAGSVDFIAGVLSTDCPVYAYCEDGWRRVVE